MIKYLLVEDEILTDMIVNFLKDYEPIPPKSCDLSLLVQEWFGTKTNQFIRELWHFMTSINQNDNFLLDKKKEEQIKELD